MRAVVVTGAGSGIGAATAARLERGGWRVFAFSRSELDVTDADSIRAAAERVEAETRELAGLVDNAGVAVAAPLEFVPPEELLRQLAVNVVGQVAVTQAFLPLLRRGAGRIVLMGSRSGRLAAPFLGPYAASKFALEAVADTLRMELRPWGIHVVLVQAASIATPMWEKGRAAGAALLERMPPDVHGLYGEQIEAMRRTAGAIAAAGSAPDEVAAVVERALSARRPPARYLVGRQARLSLWVSRMPARLRDRIVLSRLR